MWLFIAGIVADPHLETIRGLISEHPKASKLDHVLREYESGRFLTTSEEVIEFLGINRVALLKNEYKQAVTDREQLTIQVLRAFWRKTDSQIFKMLDNPLRCINSEFARLSEV